MLSSSSSSSSANSRRFTSLKNGAPVANKLSSLTLGLNGPSLLQDTALIEESAHFNRERIPERVVHAKGAAAHGHFVKTHDGIERYTRAKLFQAKGQATRVSVRFSHVTGESGISDTIRDFRGFAVKFLQANEGIWDLVGNNFPVFFIKDPINFASFIHTQKRNPRTHLKDPNAFWDFVSQMPESLHAITMLFSDRGLPDGFRRMHGYGVNTFKLVNAKGEAHYAKFHWICQQGISNLEQSQADALAGKDPDYALRDLQLAIANKDYPSWKLMFQVMSLSEASKCKFNPFDVTKVWPTHEFPLQEVGLMQLDSQPSNYFAHVEQLAFSPANLVPGIEPSPDRMLVGRMFSYPDAQRYRLGANYQDLPCNAPLACPFTPTYNDYITFEAEPLAPEMPNYVPSARFKRLASLARSNRDYHEHEQEFEAARLGRYRLQGDDFEQVRVLVLRVMDDDKRKCLAKNLARHLSQVSEQPTVEKVLELYTKVDSNFGKLVAHFIQIEDSERLI